MNSVTINESAHGRTNASVYFIGIGGSGMMPLARMAALAGWKVSGSDHLIAADKQNLLIGEGIKVYNSHDASKLRGSDYVVYSTAILSDHPERRQALLLNEQGLTHLFHRMDFLNLLMSRNLDQLAVAGTHGKTSTASLAGWLLIQMGFDPDILVGGHPLYLDAGIRQGSGKVGIFETDESDGSFLKCKAAYRLVLNIDHDHLDHYGDFENLKGAFQEFISDAAFVVLNADDPHLLKLMQDQYFRESIPARIYWYTTDLNTRAEIPEDLQHNGIVAEFAKDSDRLRIHSISSRVCGLEMQVAIPGRHFASNALGLLMLLHYYAPHVSLETILSACSSFPGVERRMQLLGTYSGVQVYDDYAHHPTEITAVIHALRLRLVKGGKLHIVFQPHRYTRIQSQYHQFAASLVEADELWLLPLFSAGEQAIDGVNSALLLKAVQSENPDINASLNDNELSVIFEATQPDDIMAFLGAGDISYTIREHLKNL